MTSELTNGESPARPFYHRVRRWWLLVLGSAILIYEVVTPGDARLVLSVVALVMLGLNEAAELGIRSIPHA
jgi:membrane protein implicated in regulation of membrane protease activity